MGGRYFSYPHLAVSWALIIWTRYDMIGKDNTIIHNTITYDTIHYDTLYFPLHYTAQILLPDRRVEVVETSSIHVYAEEQNAKHILVWQM